MHVRMYACSFAMLCYALCVMFVTCVMYVMYYMWPMNVMQIVYARYAVCDVWCDMPFQTVM